MAWNQWTYGKRMMARRLLEKRLSYRLPLTPENLESRLRETAEHWAGFEWEAGSTIVEWSSVAFGTIQVWAASVSEGKGVIRWALLDMGVLEKEGDWVITHSKSKRNGRSGRVMAQRTEGRIGPSGQPVAYAMLPQGGII